MKLSKETKIRVLENFYALDYLFFGKPLSEIEYCCPAIVEDYVSTKGALMSVMIEMYKLVDHSPKPIKEKIKMKKLMKQAKNIAEISKNHTKKIVATKKGRSNIKQEVYESIKFSNKKKIDIDSIIKQKIKEKSFKFGVDTMLVARCLTESKDYKKLNTFEGSLIEQAYKILRDSLVDSAMLVLDK